MSNHPAGDSFQYRATKKERRAERMVVLLYTLFFMLWCAGLLLGLSLSPDALLWGLPLWFGFSCVIAYALICLILAWTVRRHFQ